MKLIDKSSLVAEIGKRIKAIPRGETDKRLKAVYGNEAFVLNDLLSFINTLEVKEVDLEKEISFQWSKFCLDGKDKDSFVKVAKHFFELGLNASNPLTWEDIDWIVGEAVCRVSEDSDAEQICKEVLKRFKAQKGE